MRIPPVSLPRDETSVRKQNVFFCTFIYAHKSDLQMRFRRKVKSEFSNVTETILSKFTEHLSSATTEIGGIMHEGGALTRRFAQNAVLNIK